LADRTESNPVRIDVRSATRRYAVVIDPGVLSRTTDVLSAEGLRHPGAVVSSKRVWSLHGRRLRSLAGSGPVLMADGERAKNLQSIAKIYDGFAARKIERSSTVAAFGGGVVGDVGGFAAATYLRGIPVVQIPTTLLAQVDSAIGGKVGVNLRAGKNLAGAFHPPSLVLIDPQVLRTLPAREFRAGLYEVVKYGVIASRSLFDRVAADLEQLVRQNQTQLLPVIAECCRIKASVVQEDEYEAGPRRALNFGHSIGHALEAVTRYRRFKHGEAVGLGMLAAARLSAARGAMSAEEEAEIRLLVQRLGKLPPVKDLKTSQVLSAVSRDKKVRDGKLHFVLCAGIGRTAIVSDVSVKELELAIRSLGLRA